jgi:tetratricopeptide (TPR) repeat protein
VTQDFYKLSMGIIKDIKVGLISGKAFSEFCKGHYEDAIVLLKKLLELDPEEDEGKEIVYSLLGRSYIQVNRYKEALLEMKKANEMFLENFSKRKNDEDYKKQYLDFLDWYIYLLDKLKMCDDLMDIKKLKASIFKS